MTPTHAPCGQYGSHTVVLPGGIGSVIGGNPQKDSKWGRKLQAGGAVGSSAVRWAGWLYQVMQVSITVLYQVLMLLLALLRLAGAATPRHPRPTPA